ncbi:MAG: hypothetical protein ACRD4Q_09620 [Candidatus Acidiferrales bacterium]
MIENTFGDFVRKNFTALDELVRRYSEYKIEVAQSYWNDLRVSIQKKTPVNYIFDGADKELLLPKRSERVCGWSRPINERGHKVTIGFGIDMQPAELARGTWPFNRCLSGARVWADRDWQLNFYNIGRQKVSDTEPSDDSWVLWKFWQPPHAIKPEDLNDRLTE